MYRFLFSLSLLLFSLSQLFSQSAEGRLYTHVKNPAFGSGGVLSYIEYPGASNHFIDSIDGKSLAIGSGKVFLATDSVIHLYDKSTLIKTDTILSKNIFKIIHHQDMLIVSSYFQPYLRVFDVNSLQNIWTADSSKVSSSPSDMLADSSLLYLLQGDHLQIIDLALKDTIGSVATPAPFAFGHFGSFMIQDSADIYIDYEYATGAIRFSMARVNKNSLAFDTLFHNEGNANDDGFKAVLAPNRIYTLGFPSYYDISQDSLFIHSGFEPKAIAYDDESQTMFVAYNRFNINSAISQFINGTRMDSIKLSGRLNLSSWENKKMDDTTGISSLNMSGIEIYPNPASDIITIDISQELRIKEIRIYDSIGKLILKRSGKYSNPESIELNGYSSGIYLLEIQTSSSKFVHKLLIE